MFIYYLYIITGASIYIIILTVTQEMEEAEDTGSVGQRTGTYGALTDTRHVILQVRWQVCSRKHWMHLERMNGV